MSRSSHLGSLLAAIALISIAGCATYEAQCTENGYQEGTAEFQECVKRIHAEVRRSNRTLRGHGQGAGG